MDTLIKSKRDILILTFAAVSVFTIGCTCSTVYSSMNRATRANINASPRVCDDPSWKCVMMYRGRPRNPRLDTFGGQCGQDLTIAEIFKHGQGTFLDLASNDAVYLSNSLSLEQKYNWTGLCIEPNPVYTQGYLHRNCQLIQAVVGPAEGIKVEFNFDGYMGGIDGFDNKNSTKTDTHYTVSIAKMLRDFGMPRTIDYLSLDIEGAEAWAFEAFPWHMYTFQTLTVERPKPALRSMLEQNSYTFLCYHGNFRDELWVHKSFSDYAQVLVKYQGRGQCRDPKVGENRCK